ncbi:MAG: hypothetical protein Gyms2KO_22940 [Gymnodinialimonas sp.]
MKTAALNFFEDPEFRKDIRFLVDLDELSDARARFRDVFSLKGFYQRGFGKLDRPVDVAIAAPSDLGYGISHMFYMLMLDHKTMNVRIFSSISEALTWLQVDRMEFESFKRRDFLGSREKDKSLQALPSLKRELPVSDT